MLAAGGCGGQKPTTKGLALQREDLALVSHELQLRRGEAAREVAATKAAWPLVADGLGPRRSGLMRPQIAAVVPIAETLRMPPLFHGGLASALTGQGSPIAALYRGYVGLAGRGWQLIGSSIEEIEHGSPQAARFARANVNLYIESVYDAHFSLAQIGRKLLRAYEKLGGGAAFGRTLTQSEVDALAQAYSEGANRLYPHGKARFGT